MDKHTLINNYEEIKQHQHKEYSSSDHSETCLLVDFFTAATWHMTVGPKSSFRITFQLQIEPRKGFKTFNFPEYLLKPVSHDHKDPLFETSYEFTE